MQEIRTAQYVDERTGYEAIILAQIRQKQNSAVHECHV